MKQTLLVTILVLAASLAGGLPMAHAQSQNASGNAKTKDSKPAAKDKRPHPIQEQWGCNLGSTGSGASPNTTNGVLISLRGGCPMDWQKQFSITTPALMVGKNAYMFGYHTDAEARIVADVFCQRAGGQRINQAGGSVEGVGLNLSNLQYADKSFAVRSFDPNNPDDVKLNILMGALCQR